MPVNPDKIVSFLIALLITCMIGIPFFILVLFITLKLSPAITDGHAVMPTGQVFFSFLVTIVSGIFFLVFVYKKVRRWKGSSLRK